MDNQLVLTLVWFMGSSRNYTIPLPTSTLVGYLARVVALVKRTITLHNDQIL